jgi:alpha-D-ribose 1-methylphosphonate 5-triphosphate diphosphatase
MLHAVMKLHEQGRCTLDDAVALVTRRPAQAAGLDGDVGSLEPGKIADVVVIGSVGPLPVVTRTLREGREIFVTDYHQGAPGMASEALRARNRRGQAGLDRGPGP